MNGPSAVVSRRLDSLRQSVRHLSRVNRATPSTRRLHRHRRHWPGGGARRTSPKRGVPVTLVHFRTVPYVQPIDAAAGISPIATDAFGDRLARCGIDVSRRVYACREFGPAIRKALKGTSLVFVGHSRRWWPGSSRRTQRALEAAGHLVVTVDTSASEENAHA